MVTAKALKAFSLAQMPDRKRLHQKVAQLDLESLAQLAPDYPAGAATLPDK